MTTTKEICFVLFHALWFLVGISGPTSVVSGHEHAVYKNLAGPAVVPGIFPTATKQIESTGAIARHKGMWKQGTIRDDRKYKVLKTADDIAPEVPALANLTKVQEKGQHRLQHLVTQIQSAVSTAQRSQKHHHNVSSEVAQSTAPSTSRPAQRMPVAQSTTRALEEYTMAGNEASASNPRSLYAKLNKQLQTASEFVTSEDPTLPVRWYAPFFSPVNEGIEALHLVLNVMRVVPLEIIQMEFPPSQTVLDSLPDEQRDHLLRMFTAHTLSPSQSISICHSPPNVWSPALTKHVQSPCPPEDALYAIGRTEFEAEGMVADGIPAFWAQRMNNMDEVWVPTHWQRDVFARSGVKPSKLRVIPEVVDTSLFDPAVVTPLAKMTHTDLQMLGQLAPGMRGHADDDRFKFLSVFRWEERKGWDVLLEGFLHEFSQKDHVALFIATYHETVDKTTLSEWVLGNISVAHDRIAAEKFNQPNTKFKSPQSAVPDIHFLPINLPREHLPAIYQYVDAFVLPSRAEGWGVHVLQAMAMELPVIATNWSSLREYLTEHTGYPLPIDGLVPASGPLQGMGFHWCQPSVRMLRVLMRRVVENPREAQRRAQQARQMVLLRYCPDCIGARVVNELRRVGTFLALALHYMNVLPLNSSSSTTAGSTGHVRHTATQLPTAHATPAPTPQRLHRFPATRTQAITDAPTARPTPAPTPRITPKPTPSIVKRAAVAGAEAQKAEAHLEQLVAQAAQQLPAAVASVSMATSSADDIAKKLPKDLLSQYEALTGGGMDDDTDEDDEDDDEI